MTKPKKRGPAVATNPASPSMASARSTACASSPRSDNETAKRPRSSAALAGAPTGRPASEARYVWAYCSASTNRASSDMATGRFPQDEEHSRVGRAEPRRGGGRTATPRETTAQKGTLGARGFPPSRARDAFQEDTGTPGFLDPAELARKQLVRDRRRLGLDHWLFLHKCQRMAATPFDFLRGSAPLFYAALRKAPRLAAGPEGNGWLTGDLHLENFGVYRLQSLNEEGKSAAVVFDVNDFDDAFVGPQRLDVLRLLTSTVLACRTWGLPALAVRDATEATLDGVLAGRAGGTAGRAPEAVRALLDRAAARTRKELLDGRTELTARGRRFVRGERYRSLSEVQQRRAVKAFAEYVRPLPDAVRGHHADA